MGDPSDFLKADGKPDYAKLTSAVRELGRMQTRMLALCQQIETIAQVATTDDWEIRYLSEGTSELERFANQ